MFRHSLKVTLVLLAVTFAGEVFAQQAVNWRSDLAAAKLEARQTNRLILVHYWATWCPACYRMEREVFIDPAVAATINERFVPVKLNFDNYQVDARAMGVTILPTDVILSPAGEPVGTLPGFTEPMKYAARLAQIGTDVRPQTRNDFEQARQPENVAVQTQTAPPADYLGDRYAGYRSIQTAPPAANPYSPPLAAHAEQQPAITPNTPPPSVAHLEPQVAANTYIPPQSTGQNLPGDYSPTPMAAAQPSYAQQPFPAQQPQMQSPPPVQQPAQQPVQQPVQQPSFALAQQQPAPAVQIPQQPPAQPSTGPSPPKFGLDGFCPVTLIEKKAWKFGDRRWGAVHLGVTYLFSGLEEQQKFLQTPDRYSPVCMGNDIVMLLEKGQTVQGERKHGVSFAGRIYLFSSQESLDAFTKQPRQYIAGYTKMVQANRPQYGQELR